MSHRASWSFPCVRFPVAEPSPSMSSSYLVYDPGVQCQQGLDQGPVVVDDCPPQSLHHGGSHGVSAIGEAHRFGDGSRATHSDRGRATGWRCAPDSSHPARRKGTCSSASVPPSSKSPTAATLRRVCWRQDQTFRAQPCRALHEQQGGGVRPSSPTCYAGDELRITRAAFKKCLRRKG